MKALRQIGWVATLIPLLWACENYEMPPIIPQTSSVLSSPDDGSSLVLSADDPEALIPFEVTAADFGKEGTVTYTLEMDAVGADFADAMELGSSTSNVIEVIAEDLNDEVLAKGGEFEVASNFEFRVRSSINQPLSPIVGSPVTLSVTPYNTVVDLPVLYVPGAYQGWNPENPNTVLKSVNFDDMYQGYVHILPGGSGEFKVNEMPNWDVNYGDNGADGSLDADGENILVEEFGTFYMEVDLDAMTYTLSDPLYWGIIGDATPGGWDAETKMQFDSEMNVLAITADLTAGEMKFRANEDWAFNYGGADGELEPDGDNLVVAEDGNYTITLDFNVPDAVSYTITKN